MRIHNLVLAIAVLFSGIANAQEVSAPEVTKTQVYKEEFEVLKTDPKFKDLFDEELNGISHHFERQMQVYKVVQSKWQRMSCAFLLSYNVIAITPEMMPELYTFIEGLAKKAGIPTPTIFITLDEGILNAAASKILSGAGGIIIWQKMLNEAPDVVFESILAHEIGHIKYEHINKKVGLFLSTAIASGFGLYKLFNYICPDASLKLDKIRLATMGALVISAVTKALIIGKKFERQADQFAFEAGHAEGMIEAMNMFENKVKKIDAELLATNDKLAAAQFELTPADFAELQQGLSWETMAYRFRRWIHEKTPFEEHPSNADRIAAAQTYLDAQAQVPAIEKA